LSCFIIGLSSLSLVAQKELASVSLEAKDVKSIKVRGAFCDITIQKGGKTTVEGLITGKGDREDYQIFTEVKGETLFVEVRTTSRGWNVIEESYLSIEVDSEVGQIEVNTSSGDLEARGLMAKGIELGATSGDIYAQGLSANNIYVKSTSGDMELEELVGAVILKSTSGRQKISQVKGSLETQCTSGDIEISYFEGSVAAVTTSGDIEVRNGKGFRRAVSTSGDIYGRALLLDRDVYLKATSGDISLSLMNMADDLSFNLESNSGNLRALNRRGEDEIYIQNGDLWVEAKSTSGDITIEN
ncbi:MAG: lia operon protein LiaG, partial [Cyclobacteriaceae bacterium]